jgi:hypothetical protein
MIEHIVKHIEISCFLKIKDRVPIMSDDIKLWLDDQLDNPGMPARHTPVDWVGVKTAQEAIDVLKTGNVTHISLDHDLGDEKIVGTGYQVTRWIEAAAHDGILPRIEWAIHSANPVGRKNMEAALRNADKFWTELEYNVDL